MKILGLSHLTSINHHQDRRKWLVAWLAEVRHAVWKRASDVVAQFPSAVQLDGNQFRFISPQPEISLEVVIAYPQGVVLIVLATASA